MTRDSRNQRDITPRPLLPNRQVEQAGRLLVEVAAPLTTEALAYIANVINGNDGYPSSTMGDGSRSSDATSTTERTALRALDDGRDDAGRQAAKAHEIWTMKCKREDIRDLRNSIVTQIRDYLQLCESVLPRDRRPVARCDGRGFEGSNVPWIPHSRDERNGWHDATCVEAADDSGLCPKCRVRERRWRTKMGLKPRATNAAVGPRNETEAA